MKTTLMIPALLAICSACAPFNKAITYKKTDIPANTDNQLKKVVIDIEQLADIRNQKTENKILFESEYINRSGGKPLCLNSEKFYNKESVALQISRELTGHLAQRKTFAKVLLNKKDSSDYYVTGTLLSFYGQQDYSYANAIGSQFGVIGALATAGVKTQGKMIIEVYDLKIYNKNNEVVKDMGLFNKEYEGRFPFPGDCTCVYDNINLKLKEYFTELVSQIETEIKIVEEEKAKKQGK